MSYKYSSNNSNKCVGFESIHYTINLNDVSSFVIFSEFDYVFLSMYY